MAAVSMERGDAFNVASIDDLPPLPQNAQRLLQELADEDVDLTMLCELIETDPAIAARVVALANSAYFARPVPVRTVQDAVVRVLGLNLVKNLVFSVSVNAAFNPKQCPRFDARRYWRDALLTATFARAFARATHGAEQVEPDLAYLCGLLHNIGVVALTHSVPAAMEEVFRVVEVGGAELLVAEQRELGTTHAETGVSLAERWCLPEEVCATIGHHRDWSYRGPHWNTSALVGFSKWIVNDVLAEEESFLAAPVPAGLGLEEEAVTRTTEQCTGHVDAIIELAEIFCR